MPTWQARLALEFQRRDQRTVLAARAHQGPLQLQKPLYPEGEAVCHAMIIHPPGGIAGGDALTIDIATGQGAQALITTPGATRWYKANGKQASQRVQLRVAGALEWLPQETIVYNSADVQSEIDIDLDEQAAMIGWDVVALGRMAAGEQFEQGLFAQTIRLQQSGELRWLERTRLRGGDALLDSPIGLDGARVFGCLWAVKPTAEPQWTEAVMESLRAALPTAALTCVAPHLLVARALGHSTQAVRAAMQSIWQQLRPLVFNGLPATAPRIWAT